MQVDEIMPQILRTIAVSSYSAPQDGFFPSQTLAKPMDGLSEDSRGLEMDYYIISRGGERASGASPTFETSRGKRQAAGYG